VGGLYLVLMLNIVNAAIFIKLIRCLHLKVKFNETLVKVFKLFTFLTSTMFFIPLLDYQVSIFICSNGILRGDTFPTINEVKHIK
jgi:hypothetical protein